VLINRFYFAFFNLHFAFCIEPLRLTSCIHEVADHDFPKGKRSVNTTFQNEDCKMQIAKLFSPSFRSDY
ncbi:MAG: hypothetical protein U9Q97_02365, partial [Acidobacteriota bacterium]|nr:hypothetical protein [Acidobacteriota bacterium]